MSAAAGEPGRGRRRLLHVLDLLVGLELAWLGLHHVSLAWCAAHQTLYGFPLPFVRWAGSSLDWRFSPALMAIDLGAYAALTVPLLVALGWRLRGWWLRMVVVGALAPFAGFDGVLDVLGATVSDLEAAPPLLPLDEVHPWVGLGFSYGDPRCEELPLLEFQF